MAGGEGQAARRGAAARGRVRALCRGRPAAPARRGVEVHRPARADARRQAARDPARCRREGAREGCGRAARRYRQPAAGVRRRRVRARTVRSRRSSRPASTIRPMAQALAQGDALATKHLGKVVRDRRRGGRAQHRLHGRRRRDPCRGRRRGRAADPSRVRGDRRQAGGAVHPLARRDREGRARHDGREPRGRGRPRLSGQHRARARSSPTTRMSITSRSRARATRRCTCPR